MYKYVILDIFDYFIFDYKIICMSNNFVWKFICRVRFLYMMICRIIEN